MGLSRRPTVSENNSDFSRKSQIFPPRVFCALAEEVPLGLGIGAGGQNNYGVIAIGPRKKFDDIFSLVDTIHAPTWQTDGQTPGDSKVRAYAYRRAVKIGDTNKLLASFPL